MAFVLQENFIGPTDATPAGLQGLANGASVVSAVIDNTGNLALDALVQVQIAAIASGVSSTGTVAVYVEALVDTGASIYDDSAGPNDALLMVLVVDANGQAYAKSRAIAAIFGGVLPPKFTIRVQNLCGAALAASGNAIKLNPLQVTSG